MAQIFVPFLAEELRGEGQWRILSPKEYEDRLTADCKPWILR